jgi:hypothetical protein
LRQNSSEGFDKNRLLKTVELQATSSTFTKKSNEICVNICVFPPSVFAAAVAIATPLIVSLLSARQQSSGTYAAGHRDPFSVAASSAKIAAGAQGESQMAPGKAGGRAIEERMAGGRSRFCGPP